MTKNLLRTKFGFIATMDKSIKTNMVGQPVKYAKVVFQLGNLKAN